MITEEQISQLLEEARPSIVEGFKKEITSSITWEVKSKAAQIVAAETEKWVRENIVPELATLLTESKDGLLAVSGKLAPLMVQGLVDALAKSFAEKLAQSWDRKKVFEALFGA